MSVTSREKVCVLHAGKLSVELLSMSDISGLGC